MNVKPWKLRAQAKSREARSERMWKEAIGVMMAFPEGIRLNDSQGPFPALFLYFSSHILTVITADFPLNSTPRT